MRTALYRTTRWLVATTLGFVLLGAGIVMLITPGPGILLAVAGLAILAREYAWARRLRDLAQRKLRDFRIRRRPPRPRPLARPELRQDTEDSRVA